MLHELTYSLKEHLDDEVSDLEEVVWVFPGVSLSDRDKPFATVQSLETESEDLSKDHAYFEEIYHFQVGLFTETHAKLARLTEKMKNALRRPSITLYSTDDDKPVRAGYFYANLKSETPMPAEDYEDETNKHRTYYDVEVVVTQVIN